MGRCSVDSLEKQVLVGKITSSRGIKGEVKVQGYIESFSEFTDFKVYNKEKKDLGNFEIEYIRQYNPNSYVVKFKDIVSRNQADTFRDYLLYKDRSDFPEIAGDEYYFMDLMGLTIYKADGKELSKVHQVLDYGASPILEGSDGVMIAFTEDFIAEVNMEEGKIILTEAAESFLNLS